VTNDRIQACSVERRRECRKVHQAGSHTCLNSLGDKRGESVPKIIVVANESRRKCKTSATALARVHTSITDIERIAELPVNAMLTVRRALGPGHVGSLQNHRDFGPIALQTA
jgi:hypothetical protein